MRSLLLAAALLAVNPAFSEDRMMSARPRGFMGDGHAENHANYQGLINKQRGSCCNGGDCRPTQARFNNSTSRWEAMVDGVWQTIENSNLILDDAWLQAQGRHRWDRQAHVCATARPPNGNATVYCLLPPSSDQ